MSGLSRKQLMYVPDQSTRAMTIGPGHAAARRKRRYQQCCRKSFQTQLLPLNPRLRMVSGQDGGDDDEERRSADFSHAMSKHVQMIEEDDDGKGHRLNSKSKKTKCSLLFPLLLSVYLRSADCSSPVHTFPVSSAEEWGFALVKILIATAVI